jgi:hypothetical protein
MQQAVIETVDGEAVTRYEDKGPSRARAHSHSGQQLEPMGLGMADFLYDHPAALVRKAQGDRISR